jgi:hypothetical protein
MGNHCISGRIHNLLDHDYSKLSVYRQVELTGKVSAYHMSTTQIVPSLTHVMPVHKAYTPVSSQLLAKKKATRQEREAECLAIFG